MKFSCTQENIQKGLATVSHLTSKNVNLPILKNVLIQAKENGIEFVATNLEIGIRVFVRGKVEQPGSFTVPAQVFLNYISLVSAERVDVELTGSELSIQAGNQKTKIKGEAAQEFPLLPDVDKGARVSVPVKELKQALRQALVAVSHDETRPELTGVYCAMKNNALTMAATDSYRLVERKVTLQQPAEKEMAVIIPASALSELSRILPETEEQVECYLQDNQVLFKTDAFEMTSRLIEGVFPEYQHIIPQREQTTVVVNREELIQAVKAASLFSRSGIHDINMHFSPEKKMITITTVNNHVGENITTVEAEITGDSNNTVFNYRYLLDGLASIQTPQVSMHVIDNNNPGIFRAIGAEKDQYLYLIMPIKQ